MNSKIIYLFLFIGSTLGGMIPMLWDSPMFSLSSVIFSALGGIAGIVVGYKISS